MHTDKSVGPALQNDTVDISQVPGKGIDFDPSFRIHLLQNGRSDLAGPFATVESKASESK
jgi:hypothetical protein